MEDYERQGRHGNVGLDEAVCWEGRALWAYFDGNIRLDRYSLGTGWRYGTRMTSESGAAG